MTTSQNTNIEYAAQEAEDYEELDFLSETIELPNNDLISFQHIPAGIYKGSIIESAKQLSSQKQTPFVKILIKVPLEEGTSTHIKSQLFCWLPNNKGQEQRNRLKLQQIMNMYVGLGSKNISLLKGKQVFISVYKKRSNNLNYPDIMEISAWYPNEEEALKNGTMMNQNTLHPVASSFEETLEF